MLVSDCVQTYWWLDYFSFEILLIIEKIANQRFWACLNIGKCHEEFSLGLIEFDLSRSINASFLCAKTHYWIFFRLINGWKSLKLKNLSIFKFRKLSRREWFKYRVNLIYVGLLMSFFVLKFINDLKGIEIMEVEHD